MYLSPDPIFLKLGFMEIRWYSVCIVTGIIAGFILVQKRLIKKGIDPDLAYDYVIVGLPLATITARAYYVIFRWDYYSANPSEIVKIWNGGLAIHGGLIGVLLTVLLVSRLKKIDALKILDAAAPCVLLAQSIGRWGNYFNQEAYGRVTNLPWAISVTDPGLGNVTVHPTFLYESIWCLAGMLVIIFVFERGHERYDGESFCFYLIYYSLGRFFIEWLRTDSLMFFGLKAAQIASLLMIAAGILGMIIIRKRGKADES